MSRLMSGPTQYDARACGQFQEWRISRFPLDPEIAAQRPCGVCGWQETDHGQTPRPTASTQQACRNFRVNFGGGSLCGNCGMDLGQHINSASQRPPEPAPGRPVCADFVPRDGTTGWYDSPCARCGRTAEQHSMNDIATAALEEMRRQVAGLAPGSRNNAEARARMAETQARINAPMQSPPVPGMAPGSTHFRAWYPPVPESGETVQWSNPSNPAEWGNANEAVSQLAPGNRNHANEAQAIMNQGFDFDGLRYVEMPGMRVDRGVDTTVSPPTSQPYDRIALTLADLALRMFVAEAGPGIGARLRAGSFMGTLIDRFERILEGVERRRSQMEATISDHLSEIRLLSRNLDTSMRRVRQLEIQLANATPTPEPVAVVPNRNRPERRIVLRNQEGE